LHSIASRQNSEATKTALLKDLVLGSCEYFLGCARSTVLLKSAENLVRVMQVLSTFAPNEVEPRRKIGAWNLFIKLTIHFLALLRMYITSNN
jgi:hypothetical protein